MATPAPFEVEVVTPFTVTVSTTPPFNSKAIPLDYVDEARRKGKAKVEESNAAQGMTRIGRVYTPQHLGGSSKDATTRQPIIETGPNDLWRKVQNSEAHKNALMKVLSEAYVPNNITVEEMDNMVGVLVDGGSSLNIYLLDTLKRLDKGFHEIRVLDIPASYNLLLGRPWIHAARAVPSTLHQAVKFEWNRQKVIIYIDGSNPDKGLGKNLQGITKLIQLKNYGTTFGLEYQYIWQEYRDWSHSWHGLYYPLEQPVPHLEQAFHQADTISGTTKEETLAGLKNLFLEDEDMDCSSIIEKEEEEEGGLTIQTATQHENSDSDEEDETPEEIVREVENFENKPKSNLDEIETVNFGDTKTVKETHISIYLSPAEKEEYIRFLREYEDIFAWSYDDMTGLSTSIVDHKLPTNPMCPPVKRKLRKFKPDMSLKIKKEVTKKIKAKVLRHYPIYAKLRFPCINNTAEYEACILGLNMAVDMNIQELLVISDSDLLVNQNKFADALATLSSMIQHPDKNYIDPILLRIHNQLAYYAHVEEEADGKPWFHDIKGNLYKRTPDLGLLRCVDAKEASKLLEDVHADMIKVPPNELNATSSLWPFAGKEMDVIRPIEPTTSNGNKFISVAIDYFTKWVEAASYKAMTKKSQTKTIRTGQLVLKKIFPHQDEAKGKFSPHWQGPYMVHRVLTGRALILAERDREVWLKPINSDAIKRYYA
ncbi:uncharacterized protein [Nicotiana sylvestris]|uniref:uncharacterized protein n=1 Tax=Nicotiana sylvestris TaxID=4096 RepID=UPI00388C7F56